MTRVDSCGIIKQEPHNARRKAVVYKALIYYDWNCHLLPGMREGIDSVDDAISAFSFLSELQLKKLAMMPTFDCRTESVSAFLLRRYLAMERLKPHLPSSVKIKEAARVLLTPNVHLVQDLPKLCFTKKAYLALQMPASDYDDWIDYELNRLLFHAKMKHLLFTSFELCCLFYPTEIIEKLMRIPEAVFQFHYHALTDFKCKKVMSALIKQKSTVLFGSALNSLERTYQFDLPYYIKSATDRMSVADYHSILRENELFWYH